VSVARAESGALALLETPMRVLATKASPKPTTTTPIREAKRALRLGFLNLIARLAAAGGP
jgi:hypothetical protein